MGWTSYHRPAGQTDLEHFAERWPDLTFHAHGTVDNVFYAAVSRKKNDPDTIDALVVLIQRTRGYFNFTIKELDETMGPGDAKAPQAVLDALSPTTNQYALEWRAACQRRLDQRAFLRKHLRNGDTVVLARALTFTNGDVLDTFTYRASRHRNALGAYRIPHWRDQVVEIHRDEEAITTPAGERFLEAAVAAALARDAAA